MKKILLVSHSQMIGGAEKCLHELASGLKKRGFDVYITLPSKGDNYEMFSAAGANISIISYPWWVHKSADIKTPAQKFRKLLSQIKAVINLIRLIRKIGPDVVFSNTLTLPCGAVAAKLLNIKHVWFIHELGEEDHGLFFDYGIKFSTMIMSWTSRWILINSTFVKDKFSKYISPEKFKIVSYDIPAPALSFLSESLVSSTTVVNLYVVGQINVSKGQLIAIKAHEKLLANNIDSTLNIIGGQSDEEYYIQLQEYVKQHNVRNVIFHGPKKDPFIGLSPNPIGLMCSGNEAFGRACIEYMKLGIPVISNTAGHLPHLVINEVRGLLYKKDDSDDLANKIMYLMADKELQNSITKTAKQFAMENFNEEAYVGGIINSFAE